MVALEILARKEVQEDKWLEGVESEIVTYVIRLFWVAWGTINGNEREIQETSK